MRSLVLDLATAFGFAYGDDELGVLENGSARLPATGNDVGRFLHHYRAWLLAAIARWRPDEIVFEMPILPCRGNLATLRKLYALAALTELLAQDHHVPVREANLSDIRKHFIGCVRAPKGTPKGRTRAWIKARTMTECRARGVCPADDNDADALALLSFICTVRNPAFQLAPAKEAA